MPFFAPDLRASHMLRDLSDSRATPVVDGFRTPDDNARCALRSCIGGTKQLPLQFREGIVTICALLMLEQEALRITG